MNEVDVALLFQATADGLTTLVFGYVSITSGFLAATYLVGRTAPRELAFVMVALYSVASIVLIVYCERHATSMVLYQGLLRDIGATWHISVQEPPMLLRTVSTALVISLAAIFACSLWYFYFVRKSANSAGNT